MQKHLPLTQPHFDAAMHDVSLNDADIQSIAMGLATLDGEVKSLIMHHPPAGPPSEPLPAKNSTPQPERDPRSCQSISQSTSIARAELGKLDVGSPIPSSLTALDRGPSVTPASESVLRRPLQSESKIPHKPNVAIPQVKEESLPQQQPNQTQAPQPDSRMPTILEEAATPYQRQIKGLPTLASLSSLGPIQPSDLPDVAQALEIYGNRLDQREAQQSTGYSLNKALLKVLPGDVMSLLFISADPAEALNTLQKYGKAFMVATAPGVCTDCGHLLTDASPTIRQATNLSTLNTQQSVHIIDGRFEVNCPGPSVCGTCVVYTGIAYSVNGFPATNTLFEVEQPSGLAKQRQLEPATLALLANLIQKKSPNLMQKCMHANCGLAIHTNLTEDLPLLETPKTCYPGFLAPSALQHPIVWNNIFANDTQDPAGNPVRDSAENRVRTQEKRKYEGEDYTESNRYPRQPAGSTWIPLSERRYEGAEKGTQKGKGKGNYKEDSKRRLDSQERQPRISRSRSRDRHTSHRERQPQADQHRSDRSDSRDRQPYREEDAEPAIASNKVYAAFYKALDKQ
jgi:hypothetical protein